MFLFGIDNERTLSCVFYMILWGEGLSREALFCKFPIRRGLLGGKRPNWFLAFLVF